MKRPFFARYALIILMVIAFFTPVAMRGARLAVMRMKNDVKDWLPSDFAETTDLDWFREHFLGEQFVVASWEGCTGTTDDTTFQLFIHELFPEVPPSLRQRRENAEKLGISSDDPRIDKYPNWTSNFRHEKFFDEELGLYTRQLRPTDLPPEEEFVGNRFGLYSLKDEFLNWGGQNEKWLKGDGEIWYFITPNGDLFRWTDDSSVFAPIFNSVRRLMAGKSVNGTKVATLGEVDGPWYYKNPRRLTARLFKSVTTGPAVLSQLTQTPGPDPITEEEGLERLEGYLFGPDKKQTCLVLTLTDAAKRDLRRAIGRGILGKPRGELLRIAEDAGLHTPSQPSLVPPAIAWLFPEPPVTPAPSIKMGGPPVDNVAIDEEGQITLVRLIGFSLLVGIGLAWISFRSVAVTLMVFLVGGLSAIVSVSIVYWSDSGVDAVLMSMPSLVYVLGLSGAVHIVNYYREAVEEKGPRGAPERAVLLGWKPCTLAAFTTSLGLLSLLASNILPIKKFGLFSAVGVLATLILLFTFLPSAIHLYAPARFRRPSPDGKKPRFEAVIESFWQSVGHVIIKRHRGVLAACIAILGLMAYGLNFIKTDVQLLKMFDSQATIIQHYQWLETNLGKLIPMELVIKIDPERQLTSSSTPTGVPGKAEQDPSNLGMTFLERMEVSKHVTDVLKSWFRQKDNEIIGQTMAATTFAPDLSSNLIPGSGRYRAHRSSVSVILEDHKSELIETDYLRYDKQDSSELWRISVRLGALSDVDYAKFVGDLKQAVEPVMAAYRFRDQILKTLETTTDDGSVRGTTVFVVGAKYPRRSRTAGELLAKSKDPQNDVRDPTHLFTYTLDSLLNAQGITIADWYDPRFAPPADWNSVVSGYDCVIVARDVEGLDLEALDDDIAVVDARDHKYEVGVSKTAHERGEHVATVYTGLVPVVYKAQHTLLESLIESTFLAFVMIAIVMMFLLRNPLAGLFSMIPNVFPVVVIFGFMCWRGTLIDIGSMMTASVAMGVAVDDTIHFLTWFRRGLDQGLDRFESILLAYKRVGTAMTQTTAIGGLGLAVFAFSTFTPTQRFGSLMLALLVAALVGDLIFLPALLASRQFGWVFDRTRKRESKSSESLPKSKSTAFPHGHISLADKHKTRS